MTGRSLRADVVTAAALAAFIATTWCLIHDRTSFRHWRIPLYASTDALTLFTFEKSVAEGVYWPLVYKFNPHLGAPYSANWNDFPTTDEPLVILGGLLSKKVGLYAAANALVLLAQVLAGVSFFVVCRALGYRREWGFAGGVAFGLSQYAFARGLHHLGLTYYWHIPFGLLVCWWCLSPGGLPLTGRRFWAAVAIAVATGLQNPYYSNPFLQFLAIATIGQMLRQRWRAAVAPVLIGGACLAGFLIMNLDTVAYRLEHGRNTAGFNRSYQELENYALKPFDLFMPVPGHRLRAANALAQAYLRDPLKKPYVVGEPFSQYLGFAGIAALISLVALFALRLLRPIPAAPPIEALAVLWIVLYSVIGGVNAFLGQAGVTFFRATNRYSIVIMAIALLFGAKQLTRLTATWRPVWVLVAMGVSVAAICWDQLPRVPTEAALTQIENQIASDRAFTIELEKALRPGSMVFQLPVMSFPEAQPIEKMTDYDHLRPYLHSSTLRYSYGTIRGRGNDRWQLPLSRLPASEMVSTLERFGFAAVYINRQGYADRGASLVAALAAAGRDEVIESPAGDLVGVILRPAAVPESPRGSL